jgi:hypothetical protein
VFVQACLSEFNLVGSIHIDYVFEANSVILGVAVDGDVTLLNARPEGLNNIAFFIDENSGVIPAREYFIGARVPEGLTESNHAARPTGAVSKDEITATRGADLLSWRETSSEGTWSGDQERFLNMHASRFSQRGERDELKYVRHEPGLTPSEVTPVR